jgi:hypothetical protein
VDESVDAFRQRYRSELIGARYNGWAHLAFTVGMTAVLIAWCASQLHEVGAWEWLTVPITFLYANIAEYLGHRGPMHHPRRGLAAVFERHTRQHHRFFTETRMPVDGSRDFKAVLFPPVLVTFFLLAFGAPVALLVAWLFSANVGWLFALTGTAYFLNYELLHFAYHQPADSWISRLPGMAWLRRHHSLHHDQRLMTRLHFNISYPIGDWLFGTLERRR